MITLSPLKTERRNASFNLLDLLDELVGSRLRTGDVIVASSKFIAISEGRILSLNSVVPTRYAKELSSKFNMPPQLCELIIRESDEVLGGVIGFILASKDGLLSPNAGIDKSNIEHGRVVLYPRNSLESASAIVDAMEYPTWRADRRASSRTAGSCPPVAARQAWPSRPLVWRPSSTFEGRRTCSATS